MEARSLVNAVEMNSTKTEFSLSFTVPPDSFSRRPIKLCDDLGVCELGVPTLVSDINPGIPTPPEPFINDTEFNIVGILAEIPSDQPHRLAEFVEGSSDIFKDVRILDSKQNILFTDGKIAPNEVIFADIETEPEIDSSFFLTLLGSDSEGAAPTTKLRLAKQPAQLAIQAFQDNILIGRERGEQNGIAPSIAPFVLTAIDSPDSSSRAAFRDRTWLDQGEGIGVADGDDGNSGKRKRIEGDEILGITVVGFEANTADLLIGQVEQTNSAKVQIAAWKGNQLIDTQVFSLGAISNRSDLTLTFNSSDSFDTLHLSAANIDTAFTFHSVELEAFAV